MENNLYPSPTAVLHIGLTYTLAEWQAYYTVSAAAQDVTSIDGAATLVGGVSPVAVSDYALTPASLGYQYGTDGADLGANMSLVGVSI